MANQMRVLFVCLGNICRSPLAEVVVRGQAERMGVNDQFLFASAGTGNWHVGGSADPRSAEKAQQYGLDLSAHKAQQITAANIDQWDYFVAMDQANRHSLLAMGVEPKCLLMMRQFESEKDMIADVPDPYYGGADGFEEAYHMLCGNADKLLQYLLKN